MGATESVSELERRLWNADEAFYRERPAADAVLVFPDPTGILDREGVLASLDGPDRWARVEFEDERRIDVADGVVQLIYRAVATRSGEGGSYTAYVTTTYVEEDGTWRLVSHHQTPIE